MRLQTVRVPLQLRLVPRLRLQLREQVLQEVPAEAGERLRPAHTGEARLHKVADPPQELSVDVRFAEGVPRRPGEHHPLHEAQDTAPLDAPVDEPPPLLRRHDVQPDLRPPLRLTPGQHEGQTLQVLLVHLLLERPGQHGPLKQLHGHVQRGRGREPARPQPPEQPPNGFRGQVVERVPGAVPLPEAPQRVPEIRRVRIQRQQVQAGPRGGGPGPVRRRMAGTPTTEGPD